MHSQEHQATVCVMASAKKREGYVIATTLHGGIGTEGLKPSVMDAADIPAMRSTKETEDTALVTQPDAIASALNELTVAGCCNCLFPNI